MLDHIIKCLRCVCPVCSKLLIPPQDIKEHTLDWIADAVTSHATYVKLCLREPFANVLTGTVFVGNKKT